MLMQIGSIALVGLAAYYIGARIVATSSIFAQYSWILWTVIALFAFMAFAVPAIISHLPREYVIQLNPNYWRFTKLMIIFIVILVLMIVTDLLLYIAGFQMSPDKILQIQNYRPIFIFAIMALLTIFM